MIKVYLIDAISVFFPFSNGISTFGFLGLLGPLRFWIFSLGSISLFPFYSTFDVATTIVELQQLHIKSSVIKGIVTYNLFLLKFIMNLKNDESNECEIKSLAHCPLYNQASKVD